MRTCKNLARTPLPGLLSWLRQRVQVAPGCSINGTTLGVAKDQNQTAAELFGAELQTANHGSLCMRAGVSGVPQHENVTWRSGGRALETRWNLDNYGHRANKTRLSLQNFFQFYQFVQWAPQVTFRLALHRKWLRSAHGNRRNRW